VPTDFTDEEDSFLIEIYEMVPISRQNSARELRRAGFKETIDLISNPSFRDFAPSRGTRLRSLQSSTEKERHATRR